MEALVLAAGDGKRMRPLTANTPKPLLFVGGKVILEHTICTLRDNGITKLHLLVGWKAKRVEEYFQDGSWLGVEIDYIEQDERLGTAHAIGMASNVINDDFICINGDVLLDDVILKSVLAKYEEKGSNIMTLAKVDDPSRFGVVVMDEAGKVTQVVEKPDKFIADTINAGTYIFGTDIFEWIEKTPLSSRGEYEITTTLEMLIEQNRVFGVVPDTDWLDIGHPWDLLEANEILLKDAEDSREGVVEEGVHVKGILITKKGSIIKSGTYIEGTVFVGEDTVIGPNSYIRGTTSIGKKCKVGAASEVKNSIIMDGSNVPHHNYVGDSVIGCKCNLGSGTKVANLRLDHANVKMVSKGELVDTGRRKLGVIMGDDVQTGINSTLNVGTVLSEGCRVGPGRVASGFYGPDSKIF